MLRAIILGLVLVVAVGTIVPLATDFTEAAAKVRQVRKQKKQKRAKKYRRYRSRSSKPAKRYRKSKSVRRAKNVRRVAKKRYSSSKRVRKNYKKRSYVAKKRPAKKRAVRRYTKPWMKDYQAKKTRQKTIAKRKRNMRLKRIRLAKQPKTSSQPVVRRSYQKPQNESFVSQDMPKTQPNYYQPTVNVGENDDVSLDVIGPSVGETSMKGRNQTVGGVSTTTLRRQIIDKMIQENGWVENDYSKDVGNKKVYVVVAKSTDKNNRVQSRTFYFTESNGQIYRVSSKASEESSEQVVKKTEKVIESLEKPEERPQQAQKQN